MSDHSGTVLEHRKNNYLVDIGSSVVESALKGTLNRTRLRPRVGDRVTLELPASLQGRGIITSVKPRTNQLLRPVVCNVDQIVLITSIREPQFSADITDRFLVNAGLLGINVVLAFNKDDLLVTPDELLRRNELIDIYTNCGYTCIAVSAENGTGISALEQCCSAKTSIFAGLSGVGKSTLLNRLIPGLDLRTAELSRAIERGTHTTTSALLLKLPCGGYIADTPGFARIDVSFIPAQEVELYFPELKSRIGSCRFNNCRHRDEPGCSILEALEGGHLDPTRYESYLQIQDAMLTHRERYAAARVRDAKAPQTGRRPRPRQQRGAHFTDLD